MCGIVCATVSMPLNMCDGVYMCVCNHVCVIHADVKVEKPVRAGAMVISGSWDGRACVPYAHLNIYNEHVHFLLSEFFLFDIRHHPAVPFPVLPPVSSLVSAFPASAWQSLGLYPSGRFNSQGFQASGQAAWQGCCWDGMMQTRILPPTQAGPAHHVPESRW